MLCSGGSCALHSGWPSKGYAIILCVWEHSGTTSKCTAFSYWSFLAFFPEMAGVLGVFYYGGVSPATTGLSQIMLVVMAAIAGGVSSIEGGIVGAFIAVFLTSIAGQYTQHYTTIIGLVFVLLILFLPGGVAGQQEAVGTPSWRVACPGAGRGSVTTPGAKPANPVKATRDVPALEAPGVKKPADPGRNTTPGRPDGLRGRIFGFSNI